MTRRRLMLLVAAVAAIVALVAIGHWERARHARQEILGMRGVLRAVGPLDQPSLSAYRVGLVRFDCLLYRRGRSPFALELCFDPQGRLVEAIDRRGPTPRFWSLREDPARSTIQVDRREVNRLLLKMGVPPEYDAGHRRVITK